MVKRILESSFVIIGTLVGAGFASGKEIYIFFYQYGINGIIGIIISSLLLGIVIYKVLKISEQNEIKNYKEFLNIFLKNKKELNICNTIINIFILITFYIMIAGFGAYFEQQFELNKLFGSLILSVICYFIFLKNISGLIKVSKWLVPILIISICIIGINVIDIKNIFQLTNYISENESKKWILDSVLYGSYNTILLIPVLITLNKISCNKKEKKIIAIYTSVSIITLSLIIFFMLIKIDVNIKTLEMPAVYIASMISNIFKNIYGFIILSSILTTAISLGTSFLENIVKQKKYYQIYSILICLSSILVSNIGFSNLVNLLYPVFGYIGLIQIFKIIAYKK